MSVLQEEKMAEAEARGELETEQESDSTQQGWDDW